MVHKPLHMDAFSRMTGLERKPAAKPPAQGSVRSGGHLRAQPVAGGAASAPAHSFEAKLQELIGDPMLREGNLGAVEKLLDMDGGLFAESDADVSPFEDALMGAMNLMNAEAIATVSELLQAKAARQGKTGVAAMPDAQRSLERLVTTKGIGSPLASVRMPLDRTPLNMASMERGVSSMPGNPSVRMALEGMPVDFMGVMLASVEHGNALPGAGHAANPDVTRAMAAYGRAQVATRPGAQGGVRRMAATVATPSLSTAPAPSFTPSPGVAASQASPATVAPEAAPAPAVAHVAAPENTIRAAKPYRAPRLDVTGVIAARFESGHRGIAAIGYDRRGGTSYGKYQISSRRGTMRDFLSFLNGRAPDLADRLRNAGKANTGGRTGGMPMEWKRIAVDHPKRFRDLQDEFIHRANYRPALQNILEETNINIGNSSPALREVLWSTAVQHGPKGAADIFVNATRVASLAEDHATTGAVHEKELIEAVYDERQGRFHGSSRSVRHAVKSRLERERDFALSLLGKVSASL